MKVLISTSQHPASAQLVQMLVGAEVVFGDCCVSYPSQQSNSLAHQILTFCLDQQVTEVFPLRFTELKALQNAKVLFEEFGIKVFAPDLVFSKPAALADSYASLSSSLLKLGYPNRQVALADADGRGGLITIDDAVKEPSQIWSGIQSLNFTQLGKWFNQAAFKTLACYNIGESLQQHYVLLREQKISCVQNLDAEILKRVQQKLKGVEGLYHLAASENEILRLTPAVI
ncbi:hypothetical protein BCY91_04360 [Pelobium manganitolerans]|uniref:Uncharacterized protein n=1 Tax=Pelobium manganitolerans TaxID=1842495 RepID=A0A419S5L9_9SPHI|nr:hypothetical protein [Pelobium manganitolerans]RKD16127.1 hypothetical protein BCY91_04360 [Pelobium manganitolerans]